MEAILFLIIIGLLFYLNSNISSKIVQHEERLEVKLRILKKSIDSLKDQNSTTTEKTNPVIEKEQVVVPERQAPITPVFSEIKVPENEEIVFNNDTVISEPIIQKEQVSVPEKQELITPVPLEIKTTETEKTVLNTSTAIVTPEYEKPAQQAPIIPIASEKSWWENFKEQNPDLEKFIGENLISKIGVLILVLGISYFVRYAINKDWINEPARVGIGILCGALIMVFAHKLRKDYAAFSSVLVGGAITVFYFTIGIAFHEYHLFNQVIAFAIMVVITCFSALISISYNRKELAVLSLIGGFAVPFMVSTGNGNYVVLFTYILILNAGILVLAYHKKWNIINILSYLFTVILYAGWLLKDYYNVPPHYLGALLFGFAFYFTFIVMNVIHNIRNKGAFSVTQLSILSSNTFLFYGAGMFILQRYHPELKGLFTTSLGLLNFVYASILYKKFSLDKTGLYLLIGLTLTFVTLAVPIQFEGNHITLFWAAEAFILMWLAQKSKVTIYRFGAVIIHALLLVSLMLDWSKYYEADDIMDIIINPAFMTSLFVIASLCASHYLLKKETGTSTMFSFTFDPQAYRKYMACLAIAILYFSGIIETGYQANNHVYGAGSGSAFPILYHLLFCAVFIYFLFKNNNSFYSRLASVITIGNTILFAFWFINFAFYEHHGYMATGMYQRIAFYLHYFSLAAIIYPIYLMYKENRKAHFFNILQKPFFIWAAAFFAIYIASTELMLHGLVLSNVPVTAADVKAFKMLNVYSLEEIKSKIAKENIDLVRNQIIRTGFPVLWGTLAFLFLIIGIKIQNRLLRIVALSLLGITIIKLFFYDIRNVSETGKIIAFILLGVLVLVISFVYQKIKVLVVDDTKKTDENESR
ncbi:MAG TPA: DUF2339 domain-containing protein [Flavobacterium sp.]|jgi:uncharacterized membrane protein